MSQPLFAETPAQEAAIRGAAAYAQRRTPRQMEADVFLRANRYIRLAGAGAGDVLDRARAVSDNSRLWNAVLGLVQDSTNALPRELRAGLASLAHSVLRECAAPDPDLDFIASVNENIAAGLRN